VERVITICARAVQSVKFYSRKTGHIPSSSQADRTAAPATRIVGFGTHVRERKSVSLSESAGDTDDVFDLDLSALLRQLVDAQREFGKLSQNLLLALKEVGLVRSSLATGIVDRRG